MLTLAAFIVTIGIIVTIHEFGHFQIARWCGVRVLKFSIGFGKPLWKKKFGKDKTEFVLAAIPLGGYVKMLDEREIKAEEDANPDAPKPHYSEAELSRAFNRQHVWKRIAVVLAGPAANLLLAVALFWVLFMQGEIGERPIIGEVKSGSLAAQAVFAKGEVIQKIDGKPIKTWQDVRWALLEESLKSKSIVIETINKDNELLQHTLRFDGINNDAEIDIMEKLGLEIFRPEGAVFIGEVFAGGAAEAAGLKTNDKVLTVDNMLIKNPDSLVSAIQANPNKPMNFEIERQQKIINITVTPKSMNNNNHMVGRIDAGVTIAQEEIDKLLIKQYYSPLVCVQKAVEKTWKTSIFSLKMLWYIISGKASWKGISGPVSIASYAGQSASFGLKSFLGFLAIVSISIGVLNLLPIPVLDGGHFVYYVIEIVKGSPVSEQMMLVGQKIGFGLLGLLMTVALFNDLNKLILG